MLTDILSAVVSMLIGGALLKAFQIWILPMMDQYLHSVPRLDGTKWKYSKGILEITQFGTRIKAKAVRSDGDTIGTFKYQGKIISGQLLLTWEKSQAAGYIVGAMVLKLSQDGQTLKGHTTYLDHSNGSVISRGREYTRA